MSKPSGPKVLVFDSGVGGLTVYDEIRSTLGLGSLVYVSDNGFFPYGEKTEEALVQRVGHIMRLLTQRYHPDMIVVACNTASTVVLSTIRSQMATPVVGVVPAIKPAAAQSQSKVIGLLATPGTVARPYTQQLIEAFAADCQVIKVGSRELVIWAEEKLRGQPVDMQGVKRVLQPFINEQRVDQIVLGCTHFPLLVPELQQALGRPVTWVDSARAIQQQVSRVLEQNGFVLGRGSLAKHHTAVFTAHTPEVAKLQPILEQYDLTKVEYLTVE